MAYYDSYGVQTYQPQEQDLTAALSEIEDIPKYGGSRHKQYRKTRRWQDYYRTGALQAFGYGGEGALDPLSQLQAQLQQQAAGYASVGPGAILGAQQQAARTQLGQQAAQMGVEGAYQGLMGAQQRARQSLFNRAEAQYAPQAWQVQTQARDQEQALLQALAQQELQGLEAVQFSGRNV